MIKRISLMSASVAALAATSTNFEKSISDRDRRSIL
jgi:hypothetical protein